MSNTRLIITSLIIVSLMGCSEKRANKATCGRAIASLLNGDPSIADSISAVVVSFKDKQYRIERDALRQLGLRFKNSSLDTNQLHLNSPMSDAGTMRLILNSGEVCDVKMMTLRGGQFVLRPHVIDVFFYFSDFEGLRAACKQYGVAH